MMISIPVAIGLYFATAQGIRFMEHKVGELTAGEVFSDTDVAKLAKAACGGETQTIDELIKQGVDINARGRDGVNPLLWALSCENSIGMEALLKAGASPNQKSKIGISAVYAAASYRNPDHLRMMLKYGGNPNITSNDGETAMWEAMSRGFDSGQWDNYHILLDAGFDTTKPVRGTGNIAEVAMTFRQPRLIVELIDRGYKYDPDDLAFDIYSSSIENEDGRHESLRKLIKIVKARGVDVEKIKQTIIDRDKSAGIEGIRDFSFEIEPGSKL